MPRTSCKCKAHFKSKSTSSQLLIPPGNSRGYLMTPPSVAEGCTLSPNKAVESPTSLLPLNTKRSLPTSCNQQNLSYSLHPLLNSIPSSQLKPTTFQKM